MINPWEQRYYDQKQRTEDMEKRFNGQNAIVTRMTRRRFSNAPLDESLGEALETLDAVFSRALELAEQDGQEDIVAWLRANQSDLQELFFSE